MTTLAATPFTLSDRRYATLVRTGAFAAALGARLTQLHPGLLYPDGYQYLLIAREVATGTRPLHFGSGGQAFVPSPDAAVKPLYPLLLAVVHWFGLPLHSAATITSLVAASLVVVLAGEVVWSTTGSALAATACGALCLADTSLGYWSGFPGPDTVAQALALAAALAALRGRRISCGVLAGAAIATRPELAAVAALAIGLAARSDAGRSTLRAAAPSAAATLALVYAALRPPLAINVGFAIEVALVLVAIAVGATTLRSHRSPVVVAAVAAVVVLASSGTRVTLEHDLPLALGALAAGLFSRGRSKDVALLFFAGAIAVLGATYALKNPESQRYGAMLVPLYAIAAGVALAQIDRRRAAALAATAISLALVFAPSNPRTGTDSFAALASRIPPSRLPLVTASPDAFGFLLPGRVVKALAPNAHGLILLDGAQRLYEPTLTARGTLVAIIDHTAFVRPDGTIDRKPVRLVAGTVTNLKRPASPLAPTRSGP